MTVTRIGLAPLLRGGGSVTLPKEITFACPRCGALVADKGQCLLEIRVVPGLDRQTFEAQMVVDCRTCSLDGVPPVVVFGTG